MTALLERSEVNSKVQELPPQGLRFARITLEMYDAMINAGAITNESRVELLDGKIVQKEIMNPPHIYRLRRVFQGIDRQFEGRALAFNQSDIELPRDGRPQPDICLVHLDISEDDYILPPQVYLIIEVAQSTINTDRDYKQLLYARDGIAEYWILNLNKNQLEVYRHPDGERYTQSFTLNAGETTACLAFPDDQIVWS
jgi:Uma2 family endonuclease